MHPFRVRRFYPFLYRWNLSLCLILWLFVAFTAVAQNLPEGLSVETAVGLPLGFGGQVLTVDWSNPLLKVSILSGLSKEGYPPDSLMRAEDTDPESLRIQLIEPELAGEEWQLALPLKPMSVSGDFPDGAVVVDSLFPWQLIGAGDEDPRQLLTSKSSEGLALGVRWVGDASALDSLPAIAVDQRILISWTSVSSSRTRFALIVRTSPEAAMLSELKEWLKTQLKSDDRIAIHAMGERALVGMKDWRMSAPSDPRRVERIGGLLVLSPCRIGDSVDWLRLEGSRLESSSLEDEFYPDLVTSGYGGTDPLDPRVWISRATEEHELPHWLLAEFKQPRPITQVTIAWAQMAGWSSQFNPGRVRLEAVAKPGDAWATLAIFEDVGQPVSLWRSDSPRPIRQMRLVFDKPSRMGLDSRARVSLWQAWGPWDGTTSVGR